MRDDNLDFSFPKPSEWPAITAELNEASAKHNYRVATMFVRRMNQMLPDKRLGWWLSALALSRTHPDIFEEITGFLMDGELGLQITCLNDMVVADFQQRAESLDD